MPVKEIAQIGGAIGREFSYEVIAAVAPIPQAHSMTPAQLTASGLAFRRVHRRMRSTLSSTHWCTTLRTLVAQEPPTGLTWQDCARDRDAVPQHQDHRTRGIGASPNGSHPYGGSDSALASGWRTGIEAHGADRGHLPSQPGSRTCLNAALVIGTRNQRTEAAQPPGTTWMALKSWAAPEVWTSLHPALALAKALERHDALAPIFFGLTNNVLSHGRVAESLPWVEEMMSTGETTGDADLLIAGHSLACVATVMWASLPRFWSMPTRPWTSTTTRRIVVWQTSSTTIPKLRPGSGAPLACGY